MRRRGDLTCANVTFSAHKVRDTSLSFFGSRWSCFLVIFVMRTFGCDLDLQTLGALWSLNHSWSVFNNLLRGCCLCVLGGGHCSHSARRRRFGEYRCDHCTRIAIKVCVFASQLNLVRFVQSPRKLQGFGKRSLKLSEWKRSKSTNLEESVVELWIWLFQRNVEVLNLVIFFANVFGGFWYGTRLCQISKSPVCVSICLPLPWISGSCAIIHHQSGGQTYKGRKCYMYLVHSRHKGCD